MNLKNYTSTVPVERTVARIEAALARAGVSGIQKEFRDGELHSLSFTVPMHRAVTIRLPVDADAVYEKMKEERKRLTRDGAIRLKDQALRTSWKLMQDWVEIQLSLIHLQRVDFMQVFLPYVWDGTQTFYNRLKEQNYALLLEEGTC